MNVSIETSGSKFTAFLQGRLDTAASPLFEQAIEPLLQNADKDICLDCSDLQYISSSGLRLFLSLRKAVAAASGHLSIKGLNSGLKDIFKMTGFTALFDFE